ncbi:hypothetical protein [Marivirga harenae]|uniref:hypothetical protein n=1 Tax=Marivirga harenae TaxID=2010992 RepID=UPI0026DECA86|nr:hypothetical protein [Marivirga harenae]WKV11779.1 hypothetical protein Q3Y49_16375 [Marivirga harenae]
MKYLFKTLIIVLILKGTISFAQDAKYEIMDKSFTPNNKQTMLEIANNFGNVNLAVWDKNSISVKITLEVEGYDENESKKILDKIDLSTSQTGSLISIKTTLKSHSNTSFRKKSFKINYEINLPDGHPLSVTNEFGNIFLTDYSGNTRINLEYGNLTAGSLGTLNLTHEFGKAEIESISSGEFELSYVDEFALSKADLLDLEGEFSKIKIGDITTINFDVEYGQLNIETVSNYKGSAEFSEINIDKVYSNFDLDAEYASGTIDVKFVSKDIESFQLNTEFSKSEIKIEGGANLRFDTKHSFGKLTTEGSNISFSKKMKDMSDEEYEGTIGGNANQNSTVLRIKTSYGGCKLIAN